MTNPAIFTDLEQAKAYCLTLDRPVTASVAGATWRLFPSGAALREPERFFYEMNQAQQQQAIQAYKGVELHQFAYELDLNGNVAARRILRP